MSELRIEKWQIGQLIKWDKNPRKISPDGLNRLMNQIKKLGQYKPIVVNSGEFWGEKGLIAGGNMRYEALTQLGQKEVHVALISPKTESEFIEYALSDNDRTGYYVVDMLANISLPDFELSNYGIDVNPAINLDFFVHPRVFNPSEEWEGMPEFNQEDKSAFKQVIVSFENLEDMERFARLVNQKITIKTKSIWYPAHEKKIKEFVFKSKKNES